MVETTYTVQTNYTASLSGNLTNNVKFTRSFLFFFLWTSHLLEYFPDSCIRSFPVTLSKYV